MIFRKLFLETKGPNGVRIPAKFSRPGIKVLLIITVSTLVASLIGYTKFSKTNENKDPKLALTAAITKTMTVVGHGFGHGIGMGQWGAFGYSQMGLNYQQILGTYYGQISIVPTKPTNVLVDITEFPYAWYYSEDGAMINNTFVPPGFAVFISNGKYMITKGCSQDVVQTVPANTQTIFVNSKVPQTEDGKTLMRSCSDKNPYRGSLGVENGKNVNLINMEQYLRSVVPSEMPAKWANQKGFEALKAQAVAARTYALYIMRTSGMLEDTDQSQVYHGVRQEDPRTDAAVAQTANLVVHKNNALAYTQYTSSTGGITYQTKNFPEIIDVGDMISPWHTWTRVITAQQINEQFHIPNAVGIYPVNPSSQGREDGVKILTADNKTIVVSSASFQAKLNLPSPWIDLPYPDQIPAPTLQVFNPKNIQVPPPPMPVKRPAPANPKIPYVPPPMPKLPLPVPPPPPKLTPPLNPTIKIPTP